MAFYSSFLQPEKSIQLLLELLQIPELSKYFGHRIDVVDWEQNLKTIPSQTVIPVLPNTGVKDSVAKQEVR